MSSTYPTGGGSRLSGTRSSAVRSPIAIPSHLLNRDFARAMSLPRHGDRETFGKRMNSTIPRYERAIEPRGNSRLHKQLLRKVPLLGVLWGGSELLISLYQDPARLNVPSNYELYAGPCGDYFMACTLALIPPGSCPLPLQACAGSGLYEMPGEGESFDFPNVSAISFGFPDPVVADRYTYTRSYLRSVNNGNVISWIGPVTRETVVSQPDRLVQRVGQPLPYQFVEPVPARFSDIPTLDLPLGPPGDQGSGSTNGTAFTPGWPVIETEVSPGKPPPVVIKPPQPPFPQPPGKREKEKK